MWQLPDYQMIKQFFFLPKEKKKNALDRDRIGPIIEIFGYGGKPDTTSNSLSTIFLLGYKIFVHMLSSVNIK